MNLEILDRLAAANPVPDEAAKPEVLLSKAALRDVIEERRGHAQSHAGIDVRQSARRKVLIASVAFVAGLIVGVAGMLMTRGNGADGLALESGPPVTLPAGGSSPFDFGEARLSLNDIMFIYSSDESPLIDLAAAGCDQRSPFGGPTADGFGFWVRDCAEGGNALWVLEFDDDQRLVTPAIARSDSPIFGFLSDGTLVILGLDISISEDFEVTVGSPTLWEHSSGDQNANWWVAHPVDVVFPDRDHVQADVLSDPEAYPDDEIDQIIRDFGGIFLEDYEITRVDGRLSITGVDRTVNDDGKTIRPGNSGGRTITWLEDDTGTLRPVDP